MEGLSRITYCQIVSAAKVEMGLQIEGGVAGHIMLHKQYPSQSTPRLKQRMTALCEDRGEEMVACLKSVVLQTKNVSVAGTDENPESLSCSSLLCF